MAIAPEPITSWAGVAAIVHGADMQMTGYRGLITGEEERSIFQEGIVSGLGTAGVSESSAETIAAVADVAIPLATMIPLGVQALRAPTWADDALPILWGGVDDYPRLGPTDPIVTMNDPNGVSLVGNRMYTTHAVERMAPSGLRGPVGGSSPGVTGMPGPTTSQVLRGGASDYGRGVAPQFIEDIILSGTPTASGNGRLIYLSGSVKVVTGTDGTVVTVVTH